MIIQSLLDNDFYKFTMQNAVIQLFPFAEVRYQFINRGGHVFPEGFVLALQEELDKMTNLRLSVAEAEFLKKSCPYLPPTYIDFLKGFQFDSSEVQLTQKNGNLEVFVEGSWYRTILWEVPILSLISELYYKLTHQKRVADHQVVKIAKTKIEHYKDLGIKVADFGTRRRHSMHVHQLVVEALKKYGTSTFAGTSNVNLAHQLQLKPIGTHAHEWFMFHAAQFGFKISNVLALENWVTVYKGDLGIALSDTYTTQSFFKSFDKKLSKLFDGVRHDSGDPIEFAKQTIQHYQSHQIDPLSKTIVFSDGLNPEKVDEITTFCSGKIGTSYGIGTNFTNDVGLEPMNIVIKMTEAKPEFGEWIGVVKLSDEKEKHTGTLEMIDLANKIFKTN